MSDLRDALIQLTPRERAGPRSADRFEYQRDWAICRLLQLHESGADYLIAFDIFDDVLVFNSEVTPDRVSFFQVKTRGKPPLRLTELLSRKQGKQGLLLSIMGKLYYNKLVFSEHTEALTVVSNVPFDLTLSDGSSSSGKLLFCCTDLSPTIQAKIASQLQNEHTLLQPPAFAHFTFLEVTDVPLKGHATYVRGKLTEFLERLNPAGTFRIPLFYRTIADEVKRKNNYHDDLAGFAQLVQEKAIGKTQFMQILTRSGAYEDIDSLWQRIESRLNAEQVSVLVIRKLHDAFRRFAIDRLSAADRIFQQLEDKIKKRLVSADEHQTGALSALLDSMLATLRAAPHGPECERFADDYLKAVILTCVYEK